MNNTQHIEKVAVPVAYRLAGDRTPDGYARELVEEGMRALAERLGFVWLEDNQRLVDMLCDGRPFFMLRDAADATVRVVSKRHLVEIRQLPLKRKEPA